MVRSKLKERRLSLGLTQQQLADEIQIDRSFYAKVEGGLKGCKMQTWLKIADVLEIPENELIPYITEGIKKGA